ncbi:MAG: hypothetical protein V7K84_02175 [Nostoc sp.]
MSAVVSAISSMGFAYASATLLQAIALVMMGLMWRRSPVEYQSN